MRKIIQEFMDYIDWRAFAVTIFAGIGIVFVIMAFAVAIITENAWWLLLMLPAIVCYALAFSIEPYGWRENDEN